MNIFIDAGHGGTDSGAIGINIIEKDYTLLIANKVINKLSSYNCNVGYTRNNDKYVSLSDRCIKSNNFNSDVFVSIHCNHVADPSANGFESFSYQGNTELQKIIHNEVISVLSIKDREMKKANFYVLKNTKAKAVLLELAFISNKNDSKVLNNNVDKIANAIVNGIVKYCRLKPKNQFSVQVGVFNNKSNAEKLAKELKEKGYDCIIKASV